MLSAAVCASQSVYGPRPERLHECAVCDDTFSSSGASTWAPLLIAAYSTQVRPQARKRHRLMQADALNALTSANSTSPSNAASQSFFCAADTAIAYYARQAMQRVRKRESRTGNKNRELRTGAGSGGQPTMRMGSAHRVLRPRPAFLLQRF